MIEVGNIVTLANNQEYLIIEELKKNDKRYVYTVRTLDDESITDEFVIYEVSVVGTEEYLNEISDKKIYDSLVEEFREVLTDRVLNGELKSFEEDGEEA